MISWQGYLTFLLTHVMRDKQRRGGIHLRSSSYGGHARLQEWQLRVENRAKHPTSCPSPCSSRLPCNFPVFAHLDGRRAFCFPNFCFTYFQTTYNAADGVESVPPGGLARMRTEWNPSLHEWQPRVEIRAILPPAKSPELTPFSVSSMSAVASAKEDAPSVVNSTEHQPSCLCALRGEKSPRAKANFDFRLSALL